MLKRSAAALLPLALLACAELGTVTDPDLTPRFAATTSTISEKIPIDMAVFVPCANGGNGENVVLSGNLHALSHVTINNRGGITVKSHVQPQGLTGVGQVTGDRYQGTGVTQETFTANAGTTFTFVNNYRVVGQGPGNNFLVHHNVHVTVDANGVVRTNVDNLRIDCR